MEKTNPFQSMAERWPSSILSRTEVKHFTGGIISEKYQANLDSAGLGPEGRFRIGRKVCYTVKNYVSWLESRSSVIANRQPSGIGGMGRK